MRIGSRPTGSGAQSEPESRAAASVTKHRKIHTRATVTTPEIRKENQMAASGFLTEVGRALHARQGDRRLVNATTEVLAEIAQVVAVGRSDGGGPWTEERGKRISALIEQRGMYRVRLPGGRFSDLLNRTRANDLCRMLADAKLEGLDHAAA
jgi:hypothetical protein